MLKLVIDKVQRVIIWYIVCYYGTVGTGYVLLRALVLNTFCLEIIITISLPVL